MDFSLASEDDAPAIATLRAAVGERLTREHGRGHWSSCPTEKAVRGGIKTSRVLVTRDGPAIIATLRLATKKPWAIDTRYFAAVHSSQTRRPRRRGIICLDKNIR